MIHLLVSPLLGLWVQAAGPSQPMPPPSPSSPSPSEVGPVPAVPAPEVLPPEPPPSTQQAVQKPGSSLLNPAMSVIVDGTFGYYGRHRADFDAAGVPAAGDDPSPDREGFGLQEVELAFSSAIDPYLEGAVFLTIPNLEGLEIEEAYLVTTSLPWNLQVKAGSFRSQVGRNNTQHLHLQHFTRRPLFTSLLFGADGLRGPGAQASVLLPLPWFATLYLEAFGLSTAGPDSALAPVASFGGGARSDPAHLTYSAVLEQFWDATEDASLALGLNLVTGRLFDCAGGATCPAGGNRDPRTFLYGADLTYRWKPANVVDTYASLQWTTELFLRSIADGGPTEGAGYTEPVWQFARRWYAGARFDLVGLPAHENLPRRYAGAASLTFAPSEFSRLRAYVQEIDGPGMPRATTVVFLQSEFSLGAHGAHPF